MGWDGTRWDGMRWDGMRWDGVRWKKPFKVSILFSIDTLEVS